MLPPFPFPSKQRTPLPQKKQGNIVLKGLGNLGQMMQQAQEMSAKMQGIQETLKTKKVTGAAGAGLVEVDANGLSEVLAVRIDPTLIEKQDREMIEDLLPAAINDANQKAKELHAEALQEATGDMNLPGLGEALQKFTGGAS